MSENGPWTVKEDEDFIHFLVEKADNVISPLDSAQLCDEFKQRSGSTRTVESLVKRIDVICWEPHFTYFRKLMDFDAYKKLKTMFTSTAPISLFLLREREEEAFLELNDRNRREVQCSQVPLDLSVSEINEKLTEFLNGIIPQNPNSPTNSVVFVKQYDAEATFRQEYCIDKNRSYGSSQRRRKENKKLMDFIVEKCKDSDSPLSIQELSREFIEKTGLPVKAGTIESRIRSLLSKIQKLTNFDAETKVRLLFSLSVPIDQEYLNELQKNAIVEVDEKNRIIKYATNDGRFKLQGDHSRSSKCRTGWANLRKRYMILEDSEEEDGLEEEESEEGKDKEKSGYITNSGIISEKRYPNDNFYQDEVETCTEFSLRQQQTRSENQKLMNFIANKSGLANTPLCFKQLARDFIENTGSPRTTTAVQSSMYFLRLKIPKLDNFDTQTKVRMLFSLSVPIDKDYLNELRKNAIVEVDENQRITKYKAKDGRLKLKGRHLSIPIKRKIGLQIASTKKCKVSKSQLSEDVVYDGPGEPIPAELPVKREPNLYDELIWKERDCEKFSNEFSRESIPNQLPIKQHSIEYKEQIWQEDEYKPDKMEILAERIPGESEVKTEPMEYQEQDINWQKEEYKPDPLEIFNTKQYPNGNTTDEMKLEDSLVLEYDELDYFVKK